MSQRKEHPKWLRIFLRNIAITCFTISCLYVLSTFIARPLTLASIRFLPLTLPALSKEEALAFFILCPFFGLLNNERRWFNIPLGGGLAVYGAGIFFAARHGADLSLNAAACIFSLGLAAMIVGIWREARFTPTAVATVGSLVFAIAALALLGHITGAKLAYRWDGSVGMSLEAACGFIVCGLGLIAWSIDGTRRVSSIAWLAVPVFTAFEVATVGLWMGLHVNQAEQVRSLIAAHTEGIRMEVETALRSNVNALERMARTWEKFGRPSKEEWLFNANLLLKNIKGFSKIVWVDESLYIRWAASTDPRAMLEGRSIAFEPNRVAAIKQARSQRSTTASAPVDLLSDGRGVAIFVPIQSGQMQDGFIEAGLSVSQVLSGLSASTHSSNYQLTVGAQGKALFEIPNAALMTLGQSISFDLYGSRWRIDLAPTQAFLSRTKTTLPEQVLLAGTLIALALAGVTAATQSLANRRRLTDEMNKTLEETICKLTATEKALGNSQERLSVALKGANLALWEWDMKHQIAYYSPLWKSQLGYEESEITSSPEEWTSRVHPNDLPATIQAFQDFSRNPTPDFEVEYRLRHKSGEYRWVLTRAHVYRDKHGAIEGLVGINIDITQRKAADERFARLLEAAPDGLVIISEDGKILHANSQTLALFGYTHDELIGQEMEMLVPESSRNRHRLLRHDFMDSQETRRMGSGRELFGLRKDGTTFYAEISLSPVVSDSEKLAVAAVRDISDRKKVEVELKKARDLAEQASLTKSLFLANMSHEIRTPLGVILGHAELLSCPTVTEANRFSYAAAILRNGENLIALINDLLDLSKIEAGGLEVERVMTDLAPIVHDVLTLLEIKAEQKGLYLKLLSESLIPETIVTDGARLRQIMIIESRINKDVIVSLTGYA